VHISKSTYAILLATILAQPLLSRADSASKSPQSPASSQAIVYDDTTGTTIEFNADGSDWLRIRAIGEANCVICDRQDIQAATRKATLMAKAEITKFLKEKISTSETLDSMTKTMTEHNGQTQTVSRKSVEALATTIHNSADAILKGILTLEQQSNPAEKMIRVTVGVSRKSMGVADSLQRNFNTDTASPSSPTQIPGSETRRSKNYNNF